MVQNMATTTLPIMNVDTNESIADMSEELIKTMREDYNNIQDQIYMLQQKISSKTTKLYMQVVAFFVTVSILMIIIVITTTDVFSVIKNYFEKSKNIYDKEKVYLPKDDNKYIEPTFSKNNELNTAEQSVFKQTSSQNDSLRSSIAWKKSNAVPNADKVEAQVDLRVLEPAYDDYTYSSNKNGMNFWKMLFMPPNYHKLIDSKGSPYYKFTHE